MVRVLATIDLHSHMPPAAGTFLLADQFSEMYAGTCARWLPRFNLAENVRRRLLPILARTTNRGMNTTIARKYARMGTEKHPYLVRQLSPRMAKRKAHPSPQPQICFVQLLV